jgi:hypothetical protein
MRDVGQVDAGDRQGLAPATEVADYRAVSNAYHKQYDPWTTRIESLACSLRMRRRLPQSGDSRPLNRERAATSHVASRQNVSQLGKRRKHSVAATSAHVAARNRLKGGHCAIGQFSFSMQFSHLGKPRFSRKMPVFPGNLLLNSYTLQVSNVSYVAFVSTTVYRCGVGVSWSREWPIHFQGD